MLLPDAQNPVAEGLATTMNRHKIIFLDCDGVLNRIMAGDRRYFTPECFQAFQTIVSSTGAKVVLSTSWREFADWENMLRDWFGAIGIEVIGKTPVSNTDDRANEILTYLVQHKDEIENYIVLDDIDLRKDFPGHCICTCAPRRLGLDWEWAAEAIQILRGEDNVAKTDLSSSGAWGVDSGDDC